MPRGRWGLGKDDGLASRNQSDIGSTALDNAVRDIQSGLMRCISRLIGTAKLMAETGRIEETMVLGDMRECDMLFTRSLCEIVRLTEARLD